MRKCERLSMLRRTSMKLKSTHHRKKLIKLMTYLCSMKNSTEKVNNKDRRRQL